MNVPIATFYRAKNCEFSAENALFDMNLLATQSGSVKKVASSDAKIDTPCFQTIDVASSTTLTLTHTPKTGTTPKVYLLNGDGTLGEKIGIDSTAATRTKVAISGTTVTIVLNSAEAGSAANGFNAGEQLFFMYEYEANGTSGNGAVEVVNSATNFPVGCKFVMEILGADVCDQTNKRAA